MKIMRSHVSITEDILGGTIAPDITKIAVRHHEKLDGSGYPRGLTEKELSMEEQVVAIADIVSALLGTRSYKEAYSKIRPYPSYKSRQRREKSTEKLSPF